MNASSGLRRPVPGEVPARGTPEYAWWYEGCEAEARARKEGRTKAGLEVRELVDGFAENWPHLDAAGIAACTFSIFALAGMPLRRRVRTAIKVLKGRM
jgi:hypothetical protein